MDVVKYSKKVMCVFEFFFMYVLNDLKKTKKKK